MILSKKNTPIPDPFEADELGIESNKFNSPAAEIELEVDVWYGKNLVYIESQRPFLNRHNFILYANLILLNYRIPYDFFVY